MSTFATVLKFGLFTLACLAFAGWLVVTIGNVSFEERHDYEAEFTDVSGLLVNDAVKISGVTVGKVTGLTVAPGGTALIDFEVDADIELGDETTAQVRWRDVFGLRFLYLEPAGEARLEAGARIPNERTSSPADLGLLLERITPVMRALDPETGNQVVEALAEALVGREQDVQELLSDGASLMQALASRDDEIHRLLGNAATVVDAYARREAELRGLLDSFADVSTTIAARNDTLEDAVLSLADQQAELGRLLQVNDGELRALLDELDETMGILAVNHANIDDILRTSGRGFAAYHRLSSIGQWFNINAVGVSSNYSEITSDRGGKLPEQRDPDGDEGRGGLATFFGAALTAGGR